jgi:N6-L-threonylcarbamoyladenine synthase
MILALESSCDETAVAVFDPARGLVGEWIHSQIALHARHGGVVPDLATREHLRHFAPLLERVRDGVGFGAITSVAVTRGPGLAACLAMGAAAAKALGWALRVPVVGVNHLRAHVWSPFLPLHAEGPEQFAARRSELLPHLGLLVSGGNTILFELSADGGLRTLASTRDDAAGEALDKGAKLLGLGYPGGPAIEAAAAGGRPDSFDFPRGLQGAEDLGFSFSGLKTSLRYRLEKMPTTEVGPALPDLCASYQQAVVDALVGKTRAALNRGEGGYRSLGLSGGVANNRTLRAALAEEARRAGVPLLAAEPRHTGDNAGMIAFAAWAEPVSDSPDTSGLTLRIDPSLAMV